MFLEQVVCFCRTVRNCPLSQPLLDVVQSVLLSFSLVVTTAMTFSDDDDDDDDFYGDDDDDDRNDSEGVATHGWIMHPS